MFAAAVIVVGAASAAMVAAVRKAADRIVEAVERVEHAVYHYSMQFRLQNAVKTRVQESAAM